MRGLLPLLLVLTLLASGCTREKVNPYEPKVANEVGVARIIVQDNHQQRVSSATVLVTPAGAYGQTDVQGIFMAEDLPPGNATATVNASGYSDAHASFKVVAGEIKEVVLHVDRIR